MAEFCLQCWNRLNDRRDTEKDVTLSKEVDLCEGCGKLCRVVVSIKPAWRRLKWLRGRP